MVEPDAITPAPGGPRKLGRYHVLEVLGEGGMGVVYRAFDPKLERPVALKVVKPPKLGADGQTLALFRDRLFREARALAEISHPNVVAIFDVGTVGDDDVFLAMEFVAGQSLSEWLKSARRPLAEILRVLEDAARGLAAAHEAGVLHRDFKPDNVLVGEDGRARVLDFGLAGHRRPEAESRLGTSTDSGDSREREGSTSGLFDVTRSGVSVADQGVTRVGDVFGTPGYMPLEQILGQTVDLRADVFALCVTWWQALYGERPFSGRSLKAQRRAMERQRIRRGRRPIQGSAWLRPLLLRGLALAADDRYASIFDFLDAVAAARRRRARWRRASIACASVAGIAWALSAALAPAVDPADRCDLGDAKVAAAWNHTKRMSMEKAFAATGLAYAQSTLETIEVELGTYANAWGTAYRDNCVSTMVNRQQSDADFDRSMHCLATSLRGFSSLMFELGEGDAGTVRRAVTAVASLTPPENCRDLEWLTRRRRLPSEPGLRARVAEIDAEIAEINAVRQLGRLPKALTAASTLVETAEQLAYPPALAAVYSTYASLLQAMARPETASEYFQRALSSAVAEKNAWQAAVAANNLVYVRGYRLQRRSEVDELLATARAHITRAGSDDELLEIFHRNRGIMIGSGGDPGRALIEFRKVLDFAERRWGVESLATIEALGNLAAASTGIADHDASIDYLLRARDLYLRYYPESHPYLIRKYEQLGAAYNRNGLYVQAVECSERALSLCIDVFGAAEVACENQWESSVRDNFEGGRWHRAAQLARKWAAHERGHLPRHRRPVQLWQAEIALARGRPDRAATYIEQLQSRLEVAPRVLDFVRVLEAFVRAGIRAEIEGWAPARQQFEAAMAALPAGGGVARRFVEDRWRLRLSDPTSDLRALAWQIEAWALQADGWGAHARRSVDNRIDLVDAMIRAGQLDWADELLDDTERVAIEAYGPGSHPLWRVHHRRALVAESRHHVQAAVAHIGLAWQHFDFNVYAAPQSARLHLDMARLYGPGPRGEPAIDGDLAQQLALAARTEFQTQTPPNSQGIAAVDGLRARWSRADTTSSLRRAP